MNALELLRRVPQIVVTILWVPMIAQAFMRGFLVGVAMCALLGGVLILLEPEPMDSS